MEVLIQFLSRLTAFWSFLNTAYPERSGWGGDDLAVSGGPGLDGLLDQPGEAVADEVGGAAIEPEDVLVEPRVRLAGPRPGSGGEVLLAHRPVVGAQEPAFGEAEDEMDAGQPERGVAPGGAQADRLVVVALGRQAEVAAPAVGGHGRRLGDVGGEEGVQARGRGVGQDGEPEPAETAPAGLAAAGLDRPPATRVLPAAPRPRLPGRGP